MGLLRIARRSSNGDETAVSFVAFTPGERTSTVMAELFQKVTNAPTSGLPLLYSEMDLSRHGGNILICERELLNIRGIWIESQVRSAYIDLSPSNLLYIWNYGANSGSRKLRYSSVLRDSLRAR